MTETTDDFNERLQLANLAITKHMCIYIGFNQEPETDDITFYFLIDGFFSTFFQFVLVTKHDYGTSRTTMALIYHTQKYYIYACNSVFEKKTFQLWSPHVDLFLLDFWRQLKDLPYSYVLRDQTEHRQFDCNLFLSDPTKQMVEPINPFQNQQVRLTCGSCGATVKIKWHLKLYHLIKELWKIWEELDDNTIVEWEQIKFVRNSARRSPY